MRDFEHGGRELAMMLPNGVAGRTAVGDLVREEAGCFALEAIAVVAEVG